MDAKIFAPASATPLVEVTRSQDPAAVAATEFEAAYLGSVLSNMLEHALPNPAGGHGEEMFRGVLASALAQEVAEAGGIGIAGSIEARIKEYTK